MADLGDTSMAHTAHKHLTRSWVTVLTLVLSSVLLGFAMVFQNLPLAVVGVIAGIAGIALGVTGKIMDDAH
jgi:predicted RND superfamily exporter protein